MKVRFTLFEMNIHGEGFLKEMLKADISKYRFELILTAKQMLKRLEKDGYMTKALKKSPTMNAHRDMMEFKAREIIEDVDNILKFEVLEPETDNNDAVVFEIWVNPDFFLNADVIRNSIPKFLMKRLKIKTRQSLVDEFEKSIMDDYTRKFYGEIIEDDGEALSIRSQ